MSWISATADTGVQPAGGAALDQVVLATGGATLGLLALALLVARHHARRTTLLERAGAVSERYSGLPAWAALPTLVSGIALPVALFGMMWDISLHIDNGRDEGPLANPAHYFILVGLYGVFAAGVLGIGLPRERPAGTAVRLGRFHAPVGALLIAACGGFALAGFPLDDVWHRLFGQDVTLWGPTHLMLIGGAGLTLVGQAILLAEGMRARREQGVAKPSRGQSAVTLLRRAGIMGGLLIGLSTFQGEFDFGVPQFRLVFHPMLVALAAGLALVAARLWLGRGGALLAVAFFFLMRGVIAVLVGPVLGQSMPAQPLYLGEALAIEAVALALGTQRLLRFAAVSGVAVGTVGLATEWAWTQVAFRLPWTSDLLPEAVLHAVLAGVAGALVGAMLAAGLRGDGLPRHARPLFAASLAVLGLLVADGLATTDPEGVRAQVVREGDGLVVRIDPREAAADPAWVTLTAWQGGGLVVDRLVRTGPGTFRTTEPVPTTGGWKSLVRLHDGRRLVAAPVFLPRDEGIPAPEVPASARFERPFTSEVQILQRERKDAGGGVWVAANLVVLACFLAFFAILAWGVARVAPKGPGEHARREAVVPRVAHPVA